MLRASEVHIRGEIESIQLVDAQETGCGVQHRQDPHDASEQFAQLALALCQIPLKSTSLRVSPKQSVCLSDRHYCCFLDGSEVIDNTCRLEYSLPTHLVIGVHECPHP